MDEIENIPMRASYTYRKERKGSDGLTLHPSQDELERIPLGELKELVEEKGKSPYAAGKKRYDDFDRLVRLGEDLVELVLANAKTFSEALEVLGVGRRAFMDWIDRVPTRRDWMGRRHTRPLWER